MNTCNKHATTAASLDEPCFVCLLRDLNRQELLNSSLRAELQEAEKDKARLEGLMKVAGTWDRQSIDDLLLKEPNSDHVTAETQKGAYRLGVEETADRIAAILKDRSRGEVDTWGFVAMFLEMVTQARLEMVEKSSVPELNEEQIAPPVNKEETPLEKAQRFMRETGPTLLDAKWLDPQCWHGCQSLTFKHKLEAAESRLRIQETTTEALTNLDSVVSDFLRDFRGGYFKDASFLLHTHAEALVNMSNRAKSALSSSEAVDKREAE